MDLFSEEMRRNPYPVYDQLRRISPVLHVASPDLWMIFDYEGVKRALNELRVRRSFRLCAAGQSCFAKTSRRF